VTSFRSASIAVMRARAVVDSEATVVSRRCYPVADCEAATVDLDGVRGELASALQAVSRAR